MIKTLQFKLYNNDCYINKFDKQVSICRYVYNLAKETKELYYKEGVILSNYDLQKQLTECKKEFSWLKEVNSTTITDVFDRLDSAYVNYFRKLRNGETQKLKNAYIKKQVARNLPVDNKKLFNIGKPKWAKKEKYSSMTFKVNIKVLSNGFYLPKFGDVKVFNFEYFNKDKHTIKRAILIKKCDGLYLNVIVETENINKNQVDNICAIDMGITHFLTSSDNEVIKNPKHLFKAQKQLRVEQRKLSRKYKKENKIQSKNYEKQKQVVAKVYKKVQDCRLDFLHKVSTQFAKNYSTVVIEDLNIQGMVRNTKLSKHILDCAWGKFFELLESKTKVVRVNPAYSSQECSKCGHTCKENRPTQSLFECVKCGHTANADFDAAEVLLNRYLVGLSTIDAKVVQ